MFFIARNHHSTDHYCNGVLQPESNLQNAVSSWELAVPSRFCCPLCTMNNNSDMFNNIGSTIVSVDDKHANNQP